MLTTGSKLLIGSAVLATVAALVVGISGGGPQGTIGLLSAALALGCVAAFNLWARDSNLSAMDTQAVATSEASQEAPGNSLWPMVFALGAAVAVVGLVTQQSVFTIGLILMLAGGAQWMVQAWAEAASDDSEANAAVRSRIANTLEYPLLAVGAVGGISYSFSRVMLWLSATNTVIAFSILASLIAIVAFLFAFKPSVKPGVIGGVMGVAALAIVSGGVAAGVDGEREIHPHETTAQAAAVGHCENEEEIPEVDEHVSQTISVKSNVSAEITLTKGGDLVFEVPGPVEAGADGLSLPRSNINNIIFRNETSEPRRLTIDLGHLDPDENAESEGDGHEAELHDRQQLCTSLIEQGGAQLLTLIVGAPSIAFEADDKAYRFFVPGTDEEIKLVVP